MTDHQTTSQRTELLDRARKMGEDHGRSAASWYFDENTTRETYATVLAGIDDGDPEILDTFPSSPLSGEWADDPIPRSVCEDLGIVPDDFDSLDDYDTLQDDICDAYEDGFYQASADEIERVARLQTKED